MLDEDHCCEDEVNELDIFFRVLRNVIYDFPHKMERIEREQKLLAQDQFNKAANRSYIDLNDRITSMLMQWDSTLADINHRLNKLEILNGL